MQIIKLAASDLDTVIAAMVEFWQRGDLVVYPTETCYGVGVDATSAAAVQKLLRYKSKRANKPLSIAVSDKQMAEQYANLNDIAHNIFDNFLPGPITVVASGKNNLAPGVASAQGTIGLRLPDYPLICQAVARFSHPVTATSANVSYKKNPYCLEDILTNTSGKQQQLLGLLVDAGTLPRRKTSTVIDTTLGDIQILRRGEVIIGDCTEFISRSEKQTERLAAAIFAKIKNYLGKRLMVFELYGDLGAGKTYFTKFLARHLGITTPVVSPTFILCNEYQARHAGNHFVLYHIDAYRMYDPGEMKQIGSDTMLAGANVIVIEWAEKVTEYLTPYLQEAVRVKIKFEHHAPTVRHIQYAISGPVQKFFDSDPSRM